MPGPDLNFNEKKIFDYRPAVHYTPASGWINDPNGLVYVNGQYHLFAQHYPKATYWGPMHWTHAVSDDLLHWKRLPIALYPDELGVIFSGSAVYDAANVSGLGTKEDPPIIAIYTSHRMEDGLERQSMAYSTDGLHFEKYYGNPVIPNPGVRDFRDPKVFFNPIRNCWSLVLAAGDHVEFYRTDNLREWEKTGEFKIGEHGLNGICECPDCFPLDTPEGQKWVLFVSTILPRDKVGQKDDVYDRRFQITQYYIGEFDGDTFRDTQQSALPLLVDYGTDCYAAVTYQNLDEKVMIGWGDSPQYEADTPNTAGPDGFAGKLTLARKLSLRQMQNNEFRLSSSFEGLERLRQAAYPLCPGKNRLRSQTFGLDVKAGSCGTVTISNAKGEKIVIAVKENEILLDRSMAGQTDFNEDYSKASFAITHAPKEIKGESSLEIVMDKCILEVLAEDGTVPVTTGVYPTAYYDTIMVEGELEVRYFDIY